MPPTLWLTIATDDGRGRPDPALGPARRRHAHHRHRPHGVESVPGPPRLGRDPRLRDVARLRARPPPPRRALRAGGRAHDSARRPPPRDSGGAALARPRGRGRPDIRDRKSTRLNSSHRTISYAVFCLKKKKKKKNRRTQSITKQNNKNST